MREDIFWVHAGTRQIVVESNDGTITHLLPDIPSWSDDELLLLVGSAVRIAPNWWHVYVRTGRNKTYDGVEKIKRVAHHHQVESLPDTDIFDEFDPDSQRTVKRSVRDYARRHSFGSRSAQAQVRGVRGLRRQ